MQRKLFGIISVDFDATGKLLIINSSFVKYLKKWECNEAVHRQSTDIKNAYDSVSREVFYNILNTFGIPNKNVFELKTYSRVRVGKQTSDPLPITNALEHGDALSPLNFSFVAEYDIRRVQANQ
jgi:hypothetical protein